MAEWDLKEVNQNKSPKCRGHKEHEPTNLSGSDTCSYLLTQDRSLALMYTDVGILPQISLWSTSFGGVSVGNKSS